jgi:lipoyl(octanoyl) transferase
MNHAPQFGVPAAPSLELRAYLLKEVDFEACLALQRSLIGQIADDRSWGALILCEHSACITVGREGSPGDLELSPDELRARRWSVRWVNRGGGCWLHLPGQLAVYPVLPLDQFDMGLEQYIDRLQQLFIAVLDDFGIRGEIRHGEPGVWVGSRLIAGVGVAVRDWVSYFGAILNIDPDLPSFRFVRNGRDSDGPMTSLARERRGPLRQALVRERLLDHFSTLFPVQPGDLYFSHPALTRFTSQ